MAAQLAVSNGNVSGPGQVWLKVNVQVRNNVLTVRARGNGALIFQGDGVRSVARQDRKHWLVTLADGAGYVIEQNRGCGCGR